MKKMMLLLSCLILVSTQAGHEKIDYKDPASDALSEVVTDLAIEYLHSEFHNDFQKADVFTAQLAVEF